VAELRELDIEWRFICLLMVNEEKDYEKEFPPGYVDGHTAGRNFLRICAAARAAGGNEAVGSLYKAWGEVLWYVPGDQRQYREHRSSVISGIDVAELLTDVGLDPGLGDAADSTEFDGVLRQETALAFERTGSDVGTPIITFGPPDGRSFFGPVISEVPDDDASLKLYDALVALTDVPSFAEIKRTNRDPLDLPLLKR